MIITLGGNIGAGKTTLATALAKRLGYEELYVGGLFRAAAAERSMGIEEFYASLENNPALERGIDQRQVDLMKTKDNLVIQGRISWFLAKQSPFRIINIFLAVDPRIGAERKIKEGVYPGKTVEQVLAIHQQRENDELIHYQKLYEIKNFLDPAHYDFVLDTSRLSEVEVLEKVLERKYN